MAERIPYAVVASLINRLASAAFCEFGRIYGVMDELERLKNTVESIRAVLLDAEEKQEAQNHAVRNWVRRLNGILHTADVLLDEFVIQDMRRKMEKAHKNKVTKVLHTLSPSQLVFRLKTAHEIETIQKKINDVVKDMSGLNLNSNVVVVEQTISVKRETCSYVLESDIIGREDDKKEIVSLLRQPYENQNVSLVAIVGIGGLGKTALAQLVYNDGEVQNLFEKRMWVCVSDNFDVKIVVKKILESLTNSKIDDKLSLENLQNMLRNHLSGKRYLLVLDDIWNESYEKWTQLRTHLMCGAQDSKVIVTTRTKIVAQTMGVSIPYTLNGLNPEKSWSLLKNIITYADETRSVNQTLESIGKKIAEKCSGVPLAIRTLGGLLQDKTEAKEWIDVLQGGLWKLCEDEESIMPVLKLSYQNLPPQLRQCFAYCSLYPKDWRIEKDELIQLWVAQGYFECSGGKFMEDIGNQFVNIFLMKSFFQDAEIDECGDISSFKMHDLIHDLSMHVAGNDCCYVDNENKTIAGSPMHVMLKSDDIGLLKSVDAIRMRTLILLSNNWETWNEKELSIISKFKYLRVLKLSCSLSKLCDSIGKLRHLRYLNLWYCEGGRSLLKSVSNIICLQTLILEGCEEVEFSTKDVSNLINLRQLIIQNLTASKEKKIKNGFGKLGMRERHKGVVFSNWFSSLTYIVEISLYICHDLEYLPPMERLPFLKSLYIHYLPELEYLYYEEPLLPDTFFPSLENLTFISCKKLRGWVRMRDDVNDDDSSSPSNQLSFPPFSPRLSHLRINFCPRLSRVPTFPKLGKTLSLTHSSSVKALEATLNMVDSNSSIEVPPLSLIKDLNLVDVDLDVKKFPMNWMQNLTSLEHLVFGKLPSQTFQEIKISFQDDLNYLPSLRNIKFCHCSYLKALPDWICNLSSLQHITIEDCENLASLPEGMPHLAKLQTLEVIDCPLLLEDCETQASATWPKIAHIPNIILKRKR